MQQSLVNTSIGDGWMSSTSPLLAVAGIPSGICYRVTCIGDGKISLSFAFGHGKSGPWKVTVFDEVLSQHFERDPFTAQNPLYRHAAHFFPEVSRAVLIRTG